MKLTMMGIFIGLGIGAAIVAALEFLDQSFHDAQSVAEFLNLAILSTIPPIMTAKQMRTRRLRRFALLTVLGTVLGCELLAAAIVSGIL
jgi:hypothetical protein